MALSTGTQCHSGVTEPGTAPRNAAFNSTCSRLFSLVSTYFRWWPSKGQTALSTSYTMWKALLLKSPMEGKWLLLCPFKEILYYLEARTAEHSVPTLVARENPFRRPDQPGGGEAKNPDGSSVMNVAFLKHNSICIRSCSNTFLWYPLQDVRGQVYSHDSQRDGAQAATASWVCGCEISFWGDEKVLELDRDNGFTAP